MADAPERQPDDAMESISSPRLMIEAGLLGLLAGLAAAGFHAAVDAGYSFFLDLGRGMGTGPLPGWLVTAVLGAVMVTLAFELVRRFAPEAAGSGINEMEGVVRGLRPPIRWRRIIPVKLAGGVLAMSAGLIVGREGPTIHIGGALAEALADCRRISTAHLRILIAAGAGAGLAAAFNAPFAGILFVLEELDERFLGNFPAVQTAILASITAVAVSGTLLGAGPQIHVGPYPQPTAVDVLLMLPLGAVAGALGVGFNRALLGTLDFADGLGRRARTALAAGTGAVIGLLAAVFPSATGGGELLIAPLVDAPPGTGLLVLLLAVRFVGFLASYACGTPGGLFAPLLALGSVLGLVYAAVLDGLAPGLISASGTFAVAGIVALLASTVRAPLTGVALAAAITGGFDMLLPMLAAAAVANQVAQALGGQPIYRRLLERSLRIHGKRQDAPAGAPAK